MSYLLDTNVISELRKSERRADRSMRSWVAARTPSDLHLSAITILEIELGIVRLRRRDARQANRLQVRLEVDVLHVFNGRIVPVDVAVARRGARLHVPDPRPERDARIGATAVVRGLTVATRNVADFETMGVAMIDPWSDPEG